MISSNRLKNFVTTHEHSLNEKISKASKNFEPQFAESDAQRKESHWGANVHSEQQPSLPNHWQDIMSGFARSHLSQKSRYFDYILTTIHS